MKTLIKMEVGGIKCDNPTCTYKDDSVTVENYGHYINCPCPKCGQNLLTLEAYKHVVKTTKFVNFINKWFGWLGSENDKDFKHILEHKFGANGLPERVERWEVNGQKKD